MSDKEHKVKILTPSNCIKCGKELTEELYFCKECGNRMSQIIVKYLEKTKDNRI